MTTAEDFFKALATDLDYQLLEAIFEFQNAEMICDSANSLTRKVRNFLAEEAEHIFTANGHPVDFVVGANVGKKLEYFLDPKHGEGIRNKVDEFLTGVYEQAQKSAHIPCS